MWWPFDDQITTSWRGQPYVPTLVPVCQSPVMIWVTTLFGPLNRLRTEIFKYTKKSSQYYSFTWYTVRDKVNIDDQNKLNSWIYGGILTGWTILLFWFGYGHVLSVKLIKKDFYFKLVILLVMHLPGNGKWMAHNCLCLCLHNLVFPRLL